MGKGLRLARKTAIDGSNCIKVLIELTRGIDEATIFPREQSFSDPPGKQETKTIYCVTSKGKRHGEKFFTLTQDVQWRLVRTVEKSIYSNLNGQEFHRPDLRKDKVVPFS